MWVCRVSGFGVEGFGVYVGLRCRGIPPQTPDPMPKPSYQKRLRHDIPEIIYVFLRSSQGSSHSSRGIAVSHPKPKPYTLQSLQGTPTEGWKLGFRV